jgi:hypothetical protein
MCFKIYLKVFERKVCLGQNMNHCFKEFPFFFLTNKQKQKIDSFFKPFKKYKFFYAVILENLL